VNGDIRLLLAHLARAVALYAPEAEREARANGSQVPAELVAVAEFLADCASVRRDATEPAPAAQRERRGWSHDNRPAAE